MVAQSMDSLVSLSKRRGFIFQSNNIYGGLQGVYDFGPLGVELKKNIRESWWSDIVYKNENIFGLDASILTHPLVLNYSGHEETFTDPLVDCKDCKARHRADFINDSKCPLCGSTSLTQPRDFNLMFKTNIGLFSVKFITFLVGSIAFGRILSSAILVNQDFFNTYFIFEVFAFTAGLAILYYQKKIKLN